MREQFAALGRTTPEAQARWWGNTIGRISFDLAITYASAGAGQAVSNFRTAERFGVLSDIDGSVARVLSLAERRTATATDFYNRYSWSDVKGHVSGIDVRFPVDEVTLPRGTLIAQYKYPGAKTGNYFAPIGTPANTLGIATEGRVLRVFQVERDTVVLRSRAGDYLNPKTRVTYTGGGTQYFIPNTSGIKIGSGQ